MEVSITNSCLVHTIKDTNVDMALAYILYVFRSLVDLPLYPIFIKIEIIENLQVNVVSIPETVSRFSVRID